MQTETTTVKTVTITREPEVPEVDEQDYYCYRLTSQFLEIIYLTICCRFLVKMERA